MIDRMLAEGMNAPRWMYLSFVDDTGWLGAVITRASGPLTAVLKCHMMGVNPGGEVAIMYTPPEQEIPTWAVDRLLTQAELEQFCGPVMSLGEWEALHAGPSN
jgi:hypothetical protein